MTRIYEHFLNHVPAGGCILDAGSGSGRDTREFVARGYLVEAFDASPRLAALSTRLTGVPTKILRFQDFNTKCHYDGIWACASLLHLKRNQLYDALSRLQQALRPHGVIYVSFKAGTAERIAPDGRRFTDLDEESFRQIVQDVPKLSIIETWVISGEGAFRGQGEWLNALLRNLG